jgi:hypothetical protein
MSNKSNSAKTTPVPPEHAWNLAVETTTRVGTDEARAISVLLYLTLVAGCSSDLNLRLRQRAKFLRRLRLPRSRPVPPARKGCPLFAFLYDTPANTNNLMPVYRAAERRGWNSNLLAGENVDLPRMGLGEAGASAQMLDLISHATPKEWLSALAASRKQFVAVHAEFKRLAPDCAKLIWNGRDSILSELALGMAAARGLRRLYENWQPSLVVSTSNMWPFDQAMYVEALRAGIPCFVIQHGITNRYWWPFTATKMLLWGKCFENELLKLGASCELLAICGMPAADNLFSSYQKSAGSELRNAATSFVVLSDTQARSLEPDLYACYKSVFPALVAATPHVNWSVKLHPLEDESFYQDMLGGRYPNFRILPKSTTLEQAVTQSDVACTLWSTSGLEAMMMRRPLLVLDVHPMVYQYAWWPKSGGGVYAPNLESATEFVKRASSDAQYLTALVAKQDQFLAENFANPGQAAEACLDTMEAIIKGASATREPSVNELEAISER